MLWGSLSEPVVHYDTLRSQRYLFQVPSSIVQDIPRYTDRTDRLYIANSEYHLNNIFTDAPINSSDGLMYWLDSSYNGQLIHYQTNLKKLVFIFRTRVQDLPVETSGSGFRIFAYSGGMFRGCFKVYKEVIYFHHSIMDNSVSNEPQSEKTYILIHITDQFSIFCVFFGFQSQSFIFYVLSTETAHHWLSQNLEWRF